MSLLEGKLRSAHFVVTTELTPPKGIDLSEFFAKADALKNIVDAINITESPRARMAVEPKSVAHLLQDRGIEAIVQITARDRNRIADQVDLLCVLLLGNVPLLAGVIPLKSVKMGVWLNGNVPGVHVSSAVLEELERAGPEGEAALGIEIAARTIRRLRNICSGVHVMAIGWEHRIPELLHAAGVSAN